MMKDEAIILNKKQQDAWNRLGSAFVACHKAGIQINGELDTLYAININGIDGRSLVVGGENKIITDEAQYFRPKCFMGCAADDGLGLE